MSIKEVFKELMEGMPMSMKIIGVFMILCFIFLGIYAHKSIDLPEVSDPEKPLSFLSDL